MRWCGPRRLDHHQIRRVQPQTIETYRREARGFTTWALANQLNPIGVDEWDDALVEYKNACESLLSPSKFCNLLAAVELFFPRMKGELKWAHAVLRGWEKCHVIKHTVPLGKSPGKLVSIYLAAAGHVRLGLGLVLQCHTGLRPSEMLGLCPQHISFPHLRGGVGESVVLALGVRFGTKAQRPQVAMLPARYGDIVEALFSCAQQTPPDQPLFPYSITQYRTLLKSAEAALGLGVGWGPHSPRAGWATDSRAEGVPFTEIREGGRWVSDSSPRIYLDVQSANAVLTELRTAGHEKQLRWASTGWRHYVRPELLGAPYR